MRDAEVIAHQARRLAQLEQSLERANNAEKQLLGILDRAGIKVFQEELTPDEAAFLDNFRRSTPDGQAMIREQLARWSNAEPRAAGDQLAQPAQETPAPTVQAKAPRRRNVGPVASADRPEPDLPREFFKRADQG